MSNGTDNDRSCLRRMVPGFTESPAQAPEEATFAAGCFWGVEAAFRELDGVMATRAGYAGGATSDPSYEEVSGGQTGHVEAVRVVFDPTLVSYGELLDTFWRIHDPTHVGHQGFDIGDQYRSAVFFHDERQRQLALASLAEEQRLRDRRIATDVVPAGRFHDAEPHHQQFYERSGATGATLTDLASWLALAQPDDGDD